MPFSVNLYGGNYIKTVLPAPKVLTGRLKFIPGKEYILKGNLSDKFYASELFEVKKLSFSVENVIFRDYKDNYCVVSGKIITYQNGMEIPPDENVTLVGYFYNIYKDSNYECEGFWTAGKDGKQQFRIMAYTQIRSSSINIIEEYLSHVFSGLNVGPITLRKLTDKFGLKTIESIKNDVPDLATLIKNKERRLKLVTRLKDLEEREKALEFLVQWGLPIHTVIDIIDTIGSACYASIKKNPNILFRFDNVSIKIIDKIAQNEGLKYNDPLRIEGLIKRYISFKEKTCGDIYVDYEDFIPAGTDKLYTDSIFSRYAIEKGFFKDKIPNLLTSLSLDALVNNGKIIIEDNISDNTKKCVYRQYFNFAENKTVSIIKDMISGFCINQIPDAVISANVKNFEAKGFVLDGLQKDAVKMALQNRISILSGGPGTGKTQTIKVIVDTFSSYFPDKSIQLCAPTGKASRRMSEVINLPAGTIHKTLNYIPFSDGELNDIKADFLIIDEVSMMDIDLFYRVLTHVSDNTSILLVGDYNQLPSVGPGLILRDLIDSGVIPTTILKKVFRQTSGSNIIDVAYSVLNCKPEDITRYSVKDKTSEDFIFLNIEDSGSISKYIEKYVRLMQKNGISTEDIQIITPANEGSLGVSGLNAMMKNIVNPNGKLKGEIFISSLKSFSPGDRVIQTKNNYDQGVFNGNIGYIVSVDEAKSTAVIDFDGVKHDYKRKELLDLKLGYAITVHKSQGSEFKYVIMPIAMDHMYINNRNLLYTAITRAKARFFLIGQDQAFVETCEAIQHFSRKSQIKQKLI